MGTSKKGHPARPRATRGARGNPQPAGIEKLLRCAGFEPRRYRDGATWSHRSGWLGLYLEAEKGTGLPRMWEPVRAVRLTPTLADEPGHMERRTWRFPHVLGFLCWYLAQTQDWMERLGRTTAYVWRK
jgi:hypothetical protein